MPPAVKEDKEERTPALVRQISHLDRCPKARIETYTAHPPKGGTVEVARCIECGEFAKRKVNDGRHEEGQES